MVSSLPITALEVRDLTLSSPILRCEVSQSLSIMSGLEEVFIPVRLLRRTLPYLAGGHCHAETGKGLPQTVATKLEAQNSLECHCIM